MTVKCSSCYYGQRENLKKYQELKNRLWSGSQVPKWRASHSLLRIKEKLQV